MAYFLPFIILCTPLLNKMLFMLLIIAIHSPIEIHPSIAVHSFTRPDDGIPPLGGGEFSADGISATRKTVTEHFTDGISPTRKCQRRHVQGRSLSAILQESKPSAMEFLPLGVPNPAAWSYPLRVPV